jgi:hypothetical protein
MDVYAANREILRSMVRVDRKYRGQAIRLFGQMLVEPGRYQVRVTDEFEQVGECLKIKVSTTFTSHPGDLDGLRENADDAVGGLPDRQKGGSAGSARSSVESSRNGDSAARRGASALAVEVEQRAPATHTAVQPALLIPIIMASKGTMLDNVDTFDGAAAAVPFLSQEDARGVVAHVVQELFEEAFGSDHEPVLYALLRLVFQPGRVSVRDAHRYFDRIIKSVREEADSQKLARLRNVCWFLVRNYVIIAEIPPPTGNKWVLKYARTIPLYGRADSPSHRRRLRLGLAPNSFVVPLNLPFAANSYHFRMQTGLNSYVKAHSVLWAKTGKPVRQEDIRKMSTQAYLRVRHRQAMPYAHLYTRRFDTCRRPTDLVMQIDFDEVPPGALGLTCGLAAISALVITVLAFLVPDYNDQVSGDVLGFLLAISPVAATFVGYSMEKLQRSSLSTFTGLVLTGATSLLAALVYVRSSPGLVRGAWLPVAGDVRVNVGVLVVGLVGMANASYLYWRLRDELRHYLDLLTEKNTTAMMFR